MTSNAASESRSPWRRREPVNNSFVCCGTRIDAHSPESAVSTMVAMDTSRSGAAIHLCNSYTLSLASSDDTFRETINRGDLNLADGKPLSWIGRWLGLSGSQVRGTDLLLATFGSDKGRDLSHYLYGSTPEVVANMHSELVRRYPDAQMVGYESPPFQALTEDEEDDLVKRLSELKPDVVWVGLGTPKQDIAVDRLASKVAARFVGVGAAFDFVAGDKNEAPAWLRRGGLEWAYRLVQEPGRLWRRYLIGNAAFLASLLRQRPRRVPPA
jgi:N-acetylglucosaminyldiphosphoundecaprenol N-acetyl-beta-D-mannosaminyltransferase